MLATGGDLATPLIGLRQARVQAHVILDAALDRRQRLDLLTGYVAARTHLVRAEDLRAHRGDGFNRLQCRHVARQVGVEGVDLVEVQVHAFLGLRTSTGLVDGDCVRTADAQAAGVVAAVIAGNRAADRAGLDVDDGDFGTGHGLAVGADDTTADTGGGALRECRRGGKGGEQAKREPGQPDAVRMGHYSGLGDMMTAGRPPALGSCHSTEGEKACGWWWYSPHPGAAPSPPGLTAV